MPTKQMISNKRWKRALAFCDYLQSDSVKEEQWSFAISMHDQLRNYLYEDQSRTLENYCGTIGCAIPHLAIWEQGKKDGWKFSISIYSNLLYVVDRNNSEAYSQNIGDYFGISSRHAYMIFFNNSIYGKKSFCHITKDDVAEKLREIIGIYKRQAAITTNKE